MRDEDRDTQLFDIDYYDDDPKLTALLRWMRIWGYTNDHDIRIQDTPIGRGAIATKGFNEGTVMLVHRKLFLTDDSQEIGPEGKVGRAVRKHVTEDLEVLALFLFYERYIQKEKSFWTPWIDILPQQMTQTVFFTPEELTELKGSSILGMTESLSEQLLQTWNQYKTWFVPELWPEEEFTFERYKWALATSWARTFMLSMKRSVDKEENAPEEEEEEEEEEGESESDPDTEDEDEGGKKRRKRKGHVTAFIPFADMLNYRPNDVCGGDMTNREDFFRVWSSRDVEKGEQLYVEYGNKGNTELLLYYGFAIQGNPFTTVKIAFDLQKDDPNFDWKVQKLKETIHLEPYHVDKSTHWYEVPVFKDDPADALNTPNPNPDAITLMPFLRIFVADKKVDRKNAARSVFHPLNPDSERRALELLQNRSRTLLQAYPTTIKVDETLLETSKTLSLASLQAVVSRLEEKRILHSVIVTTEGLLADLKK